MLVAGRLASPAVSTRAMGRKRVVGEEEGGASVERNEGGEWIEEVERGRARVWCYRLPLIAAGVSCVGTFWRASVLLL